jgi:hypothetical protein
LHSYLINAYQNKNGDIMLIPTKPYKGARAGVDLIYHLNASTDMEFVGATLREAFDFCKTKAADYPYINLEKSIKGYKSYRKFTQEWLSLNAVLRGEDYVFYPKKREQRGGYSGLSNDEYVYSLNISDSQLGQALLDAIERCQ